MRGNTWYRQCSTDLTEGTGLPNQPRAISRVKTPGIPVDIARGTPALIGANRREVIDTVRVVCKWEANMCTLLGCKLARYCEIKKNTNI